MRRLFIGGCALAVVALTVLGAVGQPGPRADDDGPGGPRSRDLRREPRWMRDFEQRLDEDIAWLREKGLDDYADSIQQLRQQPSSADRQMQLGKAVGRVRQVRFLVEQQPEQGAKALQALKLESRIARLSQQWQAAEKAGDAQARREAGAELRTLLEQQFDARLESTRALIDSIKRRLERHQAELKQQEQLRDRLIDTRFQELTEGGPSKEPDGILPKIGPEVHPWPSPVPGPPPSPDATPTPDAPPP